MKILVTGGAGFIGSHIADGFLRAGHQVVILDDLSTGNLANVPKEAGWHQGTILDSETLEAVFQKEKPQIVCHHAAQINVRKSVSDPGIDAQINILGSLNLIEACRRHDVQKILFASTGGAIYGEQDRFPADEGHKTDPRSPYGISKLAVEKYLQFYYWEHRIPFVALRYANVYGPRQNAHGEAGVIAIFTERLLRDQSPVIFGDGKQTRDYVFVEDVVRCNLEALNPDVVGVFNVGTGVETDVNSLAKMLKELSGSSKSPVHGPFKQGEQRRSCLHPGLLQTLPPIPLAAGLEKTVAWFRNRQT